MERSVAAPRAVTQRSPNPAARPVFPFNYSGKALTLTNRPVIIVRGRAFFDGQHATGSHAENRCNYNANMTIWEIHPVMELEVVE
jgi:hypothetical protein